MIPPLLIPFKDDPRLFRPLEGRFRPIQRGIFKPYKAFIPHLFKLIQQKGAVDLSCAGLMATWIIRNLDMTNIRKYSTNGIRNVSLVFFANDTHHIEVLGWEDLQILII